MYRMHALQLYTMSRPCLGKNDLFGLLSLGAFFARIISPLIFLHQWTRLKHAEKDGEKHKGTNVAQQSPAAGARRAQRQRGRRERGENDSGRARDA